MNPAVAVTGSTGYLGGLVARTLAGAGVPLRLIGRSPERAPHLPEAEFARAPFGDHDAVVSALTGIRTALMVSAAESADRLDQHLTFVRAAAAAGVRHVVYTSFEGAAPDAIFTLARTHGATENALRDSGMDWTFLRDNFYLDFVPHLAVNGVIAGPGGDGRAAFVARADVAAVAAATLLDPDAHAGRTYRLTGPEALSLADCARILTEFGRPTRYHEETVEEAYASRAGYGAPDWQLDAWVSTYTAIASGALAEVTDDVRRVTGRSPQGLTQVLHDQPGTAGP
jgi:NAD(P)H dehydrogenase (quinone)